MAPRTPAALKKVGAGRSKSPATRSAAKTQRAGNLTVEVEDNLVVNPYQLDNADGTYLDEPEKLNSVLKFMAKDPTFLKQPKHVTEALNTCRRDFLKLPGIKEMLDALEIMRKRLDLKQSDPESGGEISETDAELLETLQWATNVENTYTNARAQQLEKDIPGSKQSKTTTVPLPTQRDDLLKFLRALHSLVVKQFQEDSRADSENKTAPHLLGQFAYYVSKFIPDQANSCKALADVLGMDAPKKSDLMEFKIHALNKLFGPPVGAIVGIQEAFDTFSCKLSFWKDLEPTVKERLMVYRSAEPEVSQTKAKQFFLGASEKAEAASDDQMAPAILGAVVAPPPPTLQERVDLLQKDVDFLVEGLLHSITAESVDEKVDIAQRADGRFPDRGFRELLGPLEQDFVKKLGNDSIARECFQKLVGTSARHSPVPGLLHCVSVDSESAGAEPNAFVSDTAAAPTVLSKVFSMPGILTNQKVGDYFQKMVDEAKAPGIVLTAEQDDEIKQIENALEQSRNSAELSNAEKGCQVKFAEDFVVEKGINSGNYGVVLLLRLAKNHGLSVAAKFELFDLSEIEEYVIRPTECQASIDHNNVVKIYGWEIFERASNKDKVMFVTYMELLSDLTLEKAMKDETKKNDVAWIVRILLDICRALVACAELGLIHRVSVGIALFGYLFQPNFISLVTLFPLPFSRLCAVIKDLKPDNIFMAVKGDAKLGDFGLAREQGDDQTKRVGTQHYMSPEIYDSKKYSVTSDMFSFGVVAYRLLMGGDLPPTEKDNKPKRLSSEEWKNLIDKETKAKEAKAKDAEGEEEGESDGEEGDSEDEACPIKMELKELCAKMLDVNVDNRIKAKDLEVELEKIQKKL